MKIMKTLLLCGGFATRLEPITYFMPKALLPVGIAGKPVVEYAFDDVVSCGITDIILSTNSRFVQAFEYWASQKTEKMPVKIDFVVEDASSNAEKFGAVKGIAYAIKEKKIDDDLIIIASDNLYDFSVRNVIEHFNEHRKPTVAFHDIGSKEEAKKFGVATLENHRIVSFEEKPTEPASTLVSTAIYIMPKEMLGKFDEYLTETKNSDKIGDFVKWLAASTEVHGYVYKEKWHDIGSLETYKQVFDEYTKRNNGKR
jgi:glucose-1-phosphate thymidylyltransferase